MPSYIGHLIEDKVSGKRGLIVEQKQWTIETAPKECVTRYGMEGVPKLDFYVRWFDGDTYWIADESVIVLSN